MNTFKLPGGGVLRNVHLQDACEGEYCTIHNPKPSHMNEWSLYWRGDRKIFERICGHGVAHPDPSQEAYFVKAYGEKNAWAQWVHGCDGCCRGGY